MKIKNRSRKQSCSTESKFKESECFHFLLIRQTFDSAVKTRLPELQAEAEELTTHNVWFQKISILLPQKGLEILGRRGVLKSQKFKAMYEAKLEFLEGWGVIGQIPSVGGVWIFSGTTQC